MSANWNIAGTETGSCHELREEIEEQCHDDTDEDDDLAPGLPRHGDPYED